MPGSLAFPNVAATAPPDTNVTRLGKQLVVGRQTSTVNWKDYQRRRGWKEGHVLVIGDTQGDDELAMRWELITVFHLSWNREKSALNHHRN